MSYYPEKEIAIAIRQTVKGEYECIAAFGFTSQFSFYVTHNPKRSRESFENRVNSKRWLQRWSSLKIAP